MQRMKIALVTLIAVFACGILRADDLIVPPEGLNVTSAATYPNAVVSGPLTVSAGVTVSGLTTINDGGTVIVSKGVFQTKRMSVAADVSGVDGVYDFAQIQGNLFKVGNITNESSSAAARILFAGGNMLFDWNTGFGATPFVTKNGSAFVLEGSDKNAVSLWLNNDKRTLASGDGLVRFLGVDVAIRIDGANGNNVLTLGATPISWENTGDLHVTHGGVLSCDAADRLPYVHGGVQIVGAQTKLSLNGNSQKLKSLVSEGIVSTGATDTELQFGVGDTDGVLAATLSEHVVVAKEGTGALAVSNAVMGKLLVRAGTVRVVARSQVAAVVVSAGATLVVDGTELSVVSLTLEDGATLSRINGGVIEYDTSASDQTIDADVIGTTGGLSKTGGNALLVKMGGSPLVGQITVKGGRLAVYGKTCAWPFYRFSMKDAAPFAKGDYVGHAYAALGKLYLMSAAGAVVSDGLTASSPSVGAEPSTLNPGTVTSLNQYLNGTFAPATVGGPNALFSVGTYLYGGTAYQNEDLNPQIESTWERIIFRLANGVQPVSGYKMRTCWTSAGNPPKAWSLEASANGVNWLTVDERSIATPPTANAQWYNSDKPYELQKCPASSALSEGTLVRVDSGAVLDLDYVDDEAAAISGLVVDAAGGGTITKFLPAATGALYLIGDGIRGGYRVPLAFGSVKNAENLAGWLVYVNGRLKSGYRVAYKDGALEFASPGLILLFR